MKSFFFSGKLIGSLLLNFYFKDCFQVRVLYFGGAGGKAIGISEVLSSMTPEGGEVAEEQRLGPGLQQGPRSPCQPCRLCPLLDATLSFAITHPAWL